MVTVTAIELRKGKLHRLLARVLPLSLIAYGFACCDLGSAQTAPTSEALTVDDPRPVAQAVQALASRYGYVITYEDPRYAYEGDLADVTNDVRRDLGRYASGKAPKVLVPFAYTLTLSVPTASTIDVQTMSAILQQLVQAQSASNHGGHFNIERDGAIFHVIPTGARDRQGNWSQRPSILDVPISLPTEKRDEHATLAAICGAVSAASNVKVEIGGGVGGLVQQYLLGADHENARSVLTRAVTAFGPKISWVLLYGNQSTDDAYSLSLIPVGP